MPFYLPDRISRSAILSAIVLLASGCAGLPTPKPALKTDTAASQSPVAGALFAKPVAQDVVSNATRIVDIAFNVMNAEFPASRTGDARKIWNHVDEMRLKPDQVQLLARNGIRLGTATPASWPAIQTILDAGDAKITSSQLFPQRGSALPVELGSVEEGTSIFYYDSHGRLVGKSFPGGEKLILIDYAVHPELDGCTDLGVSFEINRETEEMVWEQQGGMMRQVPDHDRHRFADLTSLLTMHPGEFLVLGPRDEMKNDNLVGTQFLSSRKGEGSVRVTFLSATPYQTQAATRPPL